MCSLAFNARNCIAIVQNFGRANCVVAVFHFGMILHRRNTALFGDTRALVDDTQALKSLSLMNFHSSNHSVLDFGVSYCPLAQSFYFVTVIKVVFN